VRFLRFASVFLVIAAACGAGCEKSAATAPEPKPKQEQGVDVELAPQAQEAAKLAIEAARAAPRAGVLVAQGTLELSPRRVAKIGSLVDGRVVSMKAQIGDKVRAGEVLATIESVAVGRARAEYFQAQARLKQADKELSREKQLASEGVTSDRSVLQAQTDREVAGFEARAAAEKLRAVGLDPGSGERAAGGSALALATPIAGVVITAKARVGEAVAPADTLFTVGDLAELWLMVEVFERDLAKIHVGDAVRVTAVAVPGRVFEGRVDHVNEAMDPARRAADVRVVLPNADGALRPGMSATARVATSAPEAGDAGAAATAVLVKRGAVQFIDGLSHVFVEKGERKYELRAIEMGPAYEGDVEVTRGLAAGERVVVEGAFILKSQVLREQMGAND
jgi:cobalt-zinc-cadmium efflux system membrane fusion protein